MLPVSRKRHGTDTKPGGLWQPHLLGDLCMTPRTIAAALSVTAALLGSMALPPVTAAQTPTNTATVRAFNDAKGDVALNKKGYSKAAKRSIDLTSIRVWQSNSRASYVRVTTRHRVTKQYKKRWYAIVEMFPTRKKRDPQVSVLIRGAKASVNAWWIDNSQEACNGIEAKRSNKGRTVTVRLPWRCSWWQANSVEVEAGIDLGAFMDSPGAQDVRKVARLAWDDDLGSESQS